MSAHIRTSTGDTVAFDRHGAGEPQTPGVVFVAGAGPWRAIDPVTTRTAELLAAQGVPSLVADRLGRGESRAEEPITLDREIAALGALLDELPGPAVVCGHSSGTAIGLYAVSRGLPVAGLVLWEGPLSPDDGRTAAWAAEFGELLDARDLHAATRHFLRDIPAELVKRAEASPDFPVMVEQMDSQRADADALAWMKSPDRQEFLRSLHIPVLALVGEQTFPELTEAAEWLADVIPRARWRHVPGAHHAWEPESMAQELAAFVRDTATD